MEALWDNVNAFSNTQGKYPILIPYTGYLSSLIVHHTRWINVPSDKITRRVAEWKRRTAKSTPLPAVVDQDLERLIFLSPYRFIKLQSINLALESWEKYPAKIRLEELRL